MARSKLASLVALAFISGTIATGSLARADEQRPANAKWALETRIPEINVESTPLSKVLDFLRNYTGTNMVVDWKVLDAANVSKDTPITLRLLDTPMYKIMKVVLDQASPNTPLSFAVDHNVMTVTTQEAADKVLVTKVYVIEDLLMTAPTGSPPTFDLSKATQASTSQSTTSGGGGGGGQSSNLFTQSNTNDSDKKNQVDEKGEEIMKLITDTIRPDIWSDKGGPASIRYWNRRLIVTAPQSVLDLIGDN